METVSSTVVIVLVVTDVFAVIVLLINQFLFKIELETRLETFAMDAFSKGVDIDTFVVITLLLKTIMFAVLEMIPFTYTSSRIISSNVMVVFPPTQRLPPMYTSLLT